MSISELPALVPRDAALKGGLCWERQGGLGELGEGGIVILFQSLRDLSHYSSKEKLEGF